MSTVGRHPIGTVRSTSAQTGVSWDLPLSIQTGHTTVPRHHEALFPILMYSSLFINSSLRHLSIIINS
ncbi:unnamed protein product [Linum trigynum]|uniref:Uncharacterized protein n=1 Tax=Linum trigynum TaxID=586398 RepID=A0AAV2CVW7_9ROSI